MLKIYTTLDEVPEALREHYELSGGKYIPKVSDDHPLVINNRTLLREKGEAETKAGELQTKLDSASANGLPRGHEALPKADADLVRAVKEAGITKPEDFTTLKTEHGKYKEEAEAAQAEKHNEKVFEAMGWDKAKAALLVPAVFDLSQVELRDGKDGKKDAVAKLKQADSTFIEKPFGEVVTATERLNALVPLLTATKQDSGTPLPGHGAGGGGSNTAKPVDTYINSTYSPPKRQGAAA